MVGTVVLGIFPKEQNGGDVFLYVVGCQRILRLEVDAVESATIAAALLHGKNTLVKTSLDELRKAELDALLQRAADLEEPLEIEDTLALELADFFTSARISQRRPEYALFHIYLDSLARLEAELYCIVLSGVEQIKASLIVQNKARDERFSLPCPLGDALALALYADTPVGIVPALVQRALPTKLVLSNAPEEVRSVLEAILPSPEKEKRLQKKMDMYNDIPLVTIDNGRPQARKVGVHYLGPDSHGESNAAERGSIMDDATMDDVAIDDVAIDDVAMDDAAMTKTSDRNNTGDGVPDSILVRSRKGAETPKRVVFDLPSHCRALCGPDMPEDQEEEEALKKLLRRLVPETKVRM